MIFIHLEKTGGTSVAQALRLDVKQQKKDPNYDNGLTKHLSVRQAKKVFGTAVWNSSFRFTVIRNPWDRLVSKWFWRKDSQRLELDSNGHIPEEWFQSEMEECKQRWQLKTNLDEFLFGEHGDHPRVHHVLKFESLQSDWESLLKKKDWHHLKRELPFKNQSTTRDRDYTRYYNQRTKKMVEDWCPKMIRYFHYTF